MTGTVRRTQQQIVRRPTRTAATEIDVRTPSGRSLPF